MHEAYVWCMHYILYICTEHTSDFLPVKIWEIQRQTAIMAEQFPSFDCSFEFLNDIVNTNWWLSTSEVVSVQVESKVRSSLSAPSVRLDRSKRCRANRLVRKSHSGHYDERDQRKGSAIHRLHKSLCSSNRDNLVVRSGLGRSAHLPHFGPQKPEQSPTLQFPAIVNSAQKVQWCSVICSNRIHSDNTDEANVFPTIPVRFFSTTKRNVIRSCRITPINIL